MDRKGRQRLTLGQVKIAVVGLVIRGKEPV